jgi:hypothetical protein
MGQLLKRSFSKKRKHFGKVGKSQKTPPMDDLDTDSFHLGY